MIIADYTYRPTPDAPTYAELLDALTSLMDGVVDAGDVVAQTGLSLTDAERLLHISGRAIKHFLAHQTEIKQALTQTL